MDLAPIVLFTYNRPEHTLRTLESLANNSLAAQSKLYIICDGPCKNVCLEEMQNLQETRRVVASKQWCGEVKIISKEENEGLARSIVMGVSKILDQYDSVIVLEDDLILSPGFLNYMNTALNLYKEEENVFSVSGYMYPVEEKLKETFFLSLISTWGWGTWKRAWDFYEHDLMMLKNFIADQEEERFNLYSHNQFSRQIEGNLNGTKDTWGIRWYLVNFILGKISLYPRQTLLRNIGHDGSGANCNSDASFHLYELAESIDVNKIETKEDTFAREAVTNYFNDVTHHQKKKV